jgi:hypothetical protein
MTYTNIPGALGALAISDDATKPEKVRWCRA